MVKFVCLANPTHHLVKKTDGFRLRKVDCKECLKHGKTSLKEKD